LGLGVLGFGRIILTPSGLTPRRLPALHLSAAVGLLAVALVPTPRLVSAAAAFAQAEPRTRSTTPGTAGAFWLSMVAAHGSAFSQGTARGERVIVLLGRLSNRESKGPWQVYFREETRQGRRHVEKELTKETWSIRLALFQRSKLALFYRSVPGEADGNRDGIVTLQELQSYVQSRLQQ
jgi:hypothetical protein